MPRGRRAGRECAGWLAHRLVHDRDVEQVAWICRQRRPGEDAIVGPGVLDESVPDHGRPDLLGQRGGQDMGDRVAVNDGRLDEAGPRALGDIPRLRPQAETVARQLSEFERPSLSCRVHEIDTEHEEMEKRVESALAILRPVLATRLSIRVS